MAVGQVIEIARLRIRDAKLAKWLMKNPVKEPTNLYFNVFCGNAGETVVAGPWIADKGALRID